MAPKRPLQDILPPRQRPVRRPLGETIPSRNTPPPPPPPPQSPRQAPEVPEEPQRPRPPRRSFRLPGAGVWFALGVAVLILTLAFSYLFAGATVRVTPRIEKVFADNASFTANKSAVDGISYEIMSLERIGTREVAPSGEEQASDKATGRIVIYNNFSTQSQRLIKNTRFETSGGLIFRIPNSVVVPGVHKQNGQDVAGSIETDIIADQPGPEYNLGLSDFTVPGFKGSPQYDKFYARSKTPTTGGFIGKRLVVPPGDLANVRDGLEKELKEQLLTQAQAEKPAGYLLYESGATVSFVPEPTGQNNGKAVVTEKATLTAIILKADTLASFLAKTYVPGYESEGVLLDNPDELSVTFASGADPSSGKVSGTLSGAGNIRFVFDPEALKRDLAGKAKGALNTLVNNDPQYKNSIVKATVSLRPFWKSHFPDQGSDISVMSVSGQK